MQLTVRFFARARDLAGAEYVDLALPEPATVSDLRDALRTQLPALAGLVPALHVAIGTAYATDSTPLAAGNPVSCFPPVSGG